jgi:hypothetical protein
MAIRILGMGKDKNKSTGTKSTQNEAHRKDSAVGVLSDVKYSPTEPTRTFKQHRVLSFLSGTYLENHTIQEDSHLSGLVLAAESGSKFTPLIISIDRSLVSDFIEGLISKYFQRPAEFVPEPVVEELVPPPPKKKSPTIETL